MKHSEPTKKAKAPHPDDLSFPASYSEQGKYLLLADKFLSLSERRNVVSIESDKHFQAGKKEKKAA
jgi:hypothetical protein